MRFGLSTIALHDHSGYAVQARILARKLRAAGHQVDIFAFYGIRGAALTIGGFPHYPPGRLEYNADVIERHCQEAGTEVLITLCDLAHQDPHALARIRASGVQVLHWVPVDCSPLSVLDETILRLSGGVPLAMSRFGEQMMRDAGLDPVYVPHCVDTSVFRPLPDAAAARAHAGTADVFTLLTVAMNKDILRKGFFELYEAFAPFHAKHPASQLIMHSEEHGQFDHGEHCRLLGLKLGQDVVFDADDYLINTGRLDERYMAGLYGVADAYVCPSWGEGFCIPLEEAHSAGLPVIAADNSALSEQLVPGTDWRVPCEAKWNPLHKRRWAAPWIKGLEQAMSRAYLSWERGGQPWRARQERARQFALGYDVDAVWVLHWEPLLKRLEAGEFRA
jgi:glycosyltransferase involved in cell wall biosynthesis